MHNQIFPALIAILIMASAQALAGGGQFVYSDGEFDAAEWSEAILDQSGPQPSFSVRTELSGGSPGSYRRVSHDYGPNGGLTVGHWRNNATYDPAVDGAIASVAVSFDLVLLDGGDVSLVVAYGLLVTQGDTDFVAAYSLTTIEPVVDVWVNHGFSDLTAAQFSAMDGSGTHPDFSAGGAPLRFGFFSANSTSTGSQNSTASGIDNWAVTVFSAPADTDGDGVDDAADNCIEVPNPDQRDTDADGFGNICDADLDNDCAINFLDLGVMKAVIFATDPDADLNGDGAVNFVDVGILKETFFGQPGPSGLPTECDNSAPTITSTPVLKP